MELIFHEKQEGSLCAQHCLNALLQGPYFSPVDLAELGQRLDESEREHMAEAGFSSREYQQFMQQPSSNYDDSGFFSIQVLQEALKVWGVELEPLNSSRPVCQEAKLDPRTAQGFVCNFREHWLTIRRIGYQWFNLNSLLTAPELLSETYLSLFLTQLQHEGYSIFIVLGDLPPCDANELLRVMPVVQPIKPTLIGDRKSRQDGDGVGGGHVTRSRLSSSDDPDLQRALAESRRLDEDEDESLKRALELSMLGFEYDTPTFEQQQPPQHSPVIIPPTPALPELDADELRRRRLAFLDQSTTNPSPPRQDSAGHHPQGGVSPSQGGSDVSASTSPLQRPSLHHTTDDTSLHPPPGGAREGGVGGASSPTSQQL